MGQELRRRIAALEALHVDDETDLPKHDFELLTDEQILARLKRIAPDRYRDVDLASLSTQEIQARLAELRGNHVGKI